MNTLDDTELLVVSGGAAGLVGAAIGAYVALLDKIEKNPNDYTWTMDWYYQRGQTK